MTVYATMSETLHKNTNGFSPQRSNSTNVHVSLPLLLHRRWLARSVAYLLLLASYHRRLRSESANKIYPDYSKLPG